MEFIGQAKRLEVNDIRTIAGYLGCEVAVVQALLNVESGGRGFDEKGRPKMLFEPHVFYRELGPGDKRTQAIAAGVASSEPGKYPKDSYPRLLAAVKIDETKALRSASWGLHQGMGFNHKIMGFETVQEYVEAMTHSESAHLYAMGRFIVGNGLQRYLRRHEWSAFAKGYNGPAYAKHGYHTKLKRAYARRPEEEKYVPPPTSVSELYALAGVSEPDGRNYRGRFEEEDKRRTKMPWFTHYNKFWLALVGFGINAVTTYTGIDLELLGINSEGIVSFITAVMVYAVPNTSYDTNASGIQK